ncbi:uncharacterized protein LOC126832188 [Patella vulgata]|uniref:uncharacterized protein LOC126832188 n=1 Tax=Patella vulgata TaxID=6465 RepID=UPI0024A9F7AE|nr:uncharacterized protein LOC126832188 [Patella vulgata]
MASEERFYQAFHKYVLDDNPVRRSISAKSIRRFRDPHEALEKILNKTTLTTQRATHGNIISLGGDMLSKNNDDNLEGFERSVQEAVDAAEVRATRELKAALTRLRNQKDEERHCALQKQKEYAERLAQRISDQRDRAEEERMKDLMVKLNLEKQEELRQQWKKAEKVKERAIEKACAELRLELEKVHEAEKDNAVEEALKQANIEFDHREQETIKTTRAICAAEESVRAAQQEAKHADHVERLNKRYEILQDKWRRETEFRIKVEKDFTAMQDDYKRFLDYTDGQFHSDYLMRLRNLGVMLPGRRVNRISYEDIKEL